MRRLKENEAKAFGVPRSGSRGWHHRSRTAAALHNLAARDSEF